MENLANIRAILFDMDGTLIEHTWRLSQITEALFEAFKTDLAPLTAKEFYDVFWPKNSDMCYMMVDGIIDGDTAQRYSYINTLRTLNKEATLAQAMLDHWIELVLQEATPFKDTYQVLASLQPHFVTAIVTNGFTSMQRAKIKRYGLDQAVEFCLVSEEAGYHKPDPRIFIQALNKAGNVPPQQALFIGDTLKADIEGARSAGLQAVFMNPRDDQTPPDGVIKIKQLYELLTLLPLP